MLLALTSSHSHSYFFSGEYDSMHPQLPIINDGIVNENGRVKRGALPLKFIAPEMETHSEYWTNMAQNILQLQLRKNHLNKNMARNVIFFIGDGMSIATVTASRVYNGGEEQQLSFDKFPYSGLSKVNFKKVPKIVTTDQKSMEKLHHKYIK